MYVGDELCGDSGEEKLPLTWRNLGRNQALWKKPLLLRAGGPPAASDHDTSCWSDLNLHLLLHHLQKDKREEHTYLWCPVPVVVRLHCIIFRRVPHSPPSPHCSTSENREKHLQSYRVGGLDNPCEQQRVCGLTVWRNSSNQTTSESLWLQEETLLSSYPSLVEKDVGISLPPLTDRGPLCLCDLWIVINEPAVSEVIQLHIWVHSVTYVVS